MYLNINKGLFYGNDSHDIYCATCETIHYFVFQKVWLIIAVFSAYHGTVDNIFLGAS